MDALLRSAAEAAGKKQARQAVASLDQALEQAQLVRYSRNRVLARRHPDLVQIVVSASGGSERPALSA